jgi:8-oxo-dGTP pyrophosphatase MutT (NUDIX family)
MALEFSISAAIFIVSKDRKVLILQRNPTDSFPNKWTVPGGKMNDKDGDFSAGEDFCYYPAEYSATREVKEETGIEFKTDQIEFLCSLYLREINRFILSFYTILDKDSGSIPVVLSDNQAYMWIGRDEIKNYDFIPDIGGEIEAVYRKIEKKV